MLSVIMLDVVMASVVAPSWTRPDRPRLDLRPLFFWPRDLSGSAKARRPPKGRSFEWGEMDRSRDQW
jgi:hypothetical protein